MQTNKPAIEKKKNGTVRVEWSIFAAPFKLGRNWLSYYSLCGRAIKIHDDRALLRYMPSWIKVFLLQEDHRRPLPTNHKINPTTNTTNKIPTHTPALKMPPTTSQEDKVIAVANAKSPNNEYCFMSSSFIEVMQMVCRCEPFKRLDEVCQ